MMSPVPTAGTEFATEMARNRTHLAFLGEGKEMRAAAVILGLAPLLLLGIENMADDKDKTTPDRDAKNAGLKLEGEYAINIHPSAESFPAELLAANAFCVVGVR